MLRHIDMKSSLLSVFITVMHSSFAQMGSFGLYPVSLCPFKTNNLANYTNDSLTSSTVTWASSASLAACPSRLTPTSQSIEVRSFERGQHNVDQWVPRSNTYVLSVLRPSWVVSAYLDLEIIDAHDATVVQRMQVTLGVGGQRQSNSPAITTLSTRRSELPKSPKGKLNTAAHSKQHHTTALHSKAFKPHRGRRKGKGGVMGGFGGGGRYQGGSGGFRPSMPGAGTKPYGYSSPAGQSRFQPGYTRTAYGYSGRSAIIVGTPLFLHSRGGSTGGYYRQSCAQYTGNVHERCLQAYNGTVYSDGCEYKTRSSLMRDDLMSAAVLNNQSTFPITVIIHKAAVVFDQGVQPEPWQQTLFFAFSEVDFDDEEDEVISFVVFCILLGIGTLFLCFCCCYCFCVCRPHENETSQHQGNDGIDLEAPK